MSRPPDSRPGPSRPVRPGAPDLAGRIRATLARHPRIDDHRVEVLAADGVITLRGAVTSSAQREAAGKVARRAAGVEEVRNELVVDGVLRATF